MTRTIIRTAIHAIIVWTLTGIMAAKVDKEQAARELLEKSYQQADIWRQDSLQLVADVTLPQNNKPSLQVTYKISWASPEKWRAEWSGAGYSRIVVVSGGKMYRFSSTPVPPLPVLEYERALSALNGRGFMGPDAAVPNLSSEKIEISKQKVGKTPADCMRISHHSGDLCVDPVSAQALSAQFENTTFTYSDYIAVGSASFPTTIRQMHNNETALDSHISISSAKNFSDALFTAPANANVTDYPSCGDSGAVLQGSTLEKKVMPEYPQNAKMSRHQGNAMLYAIVGKDGSVQVLKPIAAAWPELQASAMKSVKQWRYTPYLRCGQPSEVEMLITVNYSLGGS